MARHGENIRKRIDGRWEGRYKVLDESKGKYIYRSVYGSNYAQVREKLSKAKSGRDCPEAVKKEAAYDGPKHTAENCGEVLFSHAAGAWLAEVSDKRKYSTYIKYDTIYRTHLADTIGSFELLPDTAFELREKIFDHLSAGVASESLQKSIVCVANQILSFANQIYFTDMPLLEKPPAKARPKTSEPFSEAEQSGLFACIYRELENKFMIAILLCLYTGLRLGELCALQWKDIDFKDMNLTVNRTVQRIAVPGHTTKTILVETDPKSEHSKRTIPLTAEVLEILTRLKGSGPYVFGGKKPLEPRTMQYQFKKLLKETGIDYRNFHTLRHTFATNCVENGMDVKVLCELLGHSDVKISLNRYVHPTTDSKRRQISSLSGFYGQIYGHAA